MPVAWVTFWKSTWGTRMTPADVAEQQKKDKTKAETAVKEKQEAKIKDRAVTNGQVKARKKEE